MSKKDKSKEKILLQDRKLTPKQKRFCEEYVVSLNATQAAIRVGYSKDSAYSIASENLRKPEIRNYIRELIEVRSIRTQITGDLVLEQLAEIARGKQGLKATDRFNAIDRLAKYVGFFEEKQIAPYPKTFVAEDKLKALAQAVSDKARRFIISMEHCEREKVMNRLGEKGQERLDKKIEEAIEQGKIDGDRDNVDNNGYLQRLEHELFAEVVIEAARETLPEYRFKEVLKDAGFKASNYMHESDFGLDR